MTSFIYFVAILPEQKIQDEITGFKKIVEQKFYSKRALTSPPHITIIPPFRYKEENIQEIISSLQTLSTELNSFEIELNNFNCFAPRVIYVDILSNKNLNTLHVSSNVLLEKEFGIEFKYKEQTYHPHMTIAFKDLKESKFIEAWDYFKNKKYNQVFTALQLSLLKHNGKKWEVLKSTPFK